MSPEAIDSVAAAVQPLVFETGVETAKYGTAGTAFLVGYRRRAFVITARHLLRPREMTPLCIFPSDLSRRLIPLRDLFWLPVEKVPDDFADFAIVEIDLERLDDGTNKASVINLDLAVADWLKDRHASRFVVLGYPIEHASVDYDSETVSTRRFALSGRYVGQTSSTHLHELQLDSDEGLSTFSGFSGGPVFSWFEDERGHARIALCGIAIQGTPTSKRLRFIEWQVIQSAINVKLARPGT